MPAARNLDDLDMFFTEHRSSHGDDQPDVLIVQYYDDCSLDVYGPPIAVFKTEVGLRRSFDKLLREAANKGADLSVSAWKFDD